jgi:hypothetical protein
MQIIIEQSSLDAWTGLAGVIVGAAITIGGEWLRIRRAERKERYRVNQAAADELYGAANALLTVRGAYRTERAQAEPMHQWISLMMTQAERVQKASESLVRYAPPELSRIGMEVANAAVRASVDVGKDGFPEEMESLLTSFAAESRKLPR